MFDVLIIGAGVAGASAAAELVAAGRRVGLLDKAQRPGGRCATRRITPAVDSAWFDYGAQYFTARGPAFRARVDADLATGALQHWQPAICVAERRDDAWQVTPSPDTRERLIAPGGLNHWVRRLLDAYPADLICNAHAQRLYRNSCGWQIVCDNADAYRAAALVITTPALQARALLGAEAEYIAPLAGAARALRACHSLVLEAPGLAGCHAVFVKDGVLCWIADNSHKAQRASARAHLWTLHAGPDFSDAHVKESAADVQSTLIDEFCAITGIHAAEIAPVRAHRWRYAHPGDGAPAALTMCYADREQRLALAGDWLAGGRVEGAWWSGRAAARALLESGSNAPQDRISR